MTYGSRYVLVLDPDDDDLKENAQQIVSKHGSHLVVFGQDCLASLASDSLLTIVGHGTKNYMLTSLDPNGILQGAAFARFLIQTCGLKQVGMITLASCDSAKTSNGFAARLHKALGEYSDGKGVKTKLNARTGTVVMQDGMQFVAENSRETYFYRQKIGTKVLFDWGADGQQTLETVVQGYTKEGLFRVSDEFEEIEVAGNDESNPWPAAVSE